MSTKTDSHVIYKPENGDSIILTERFFKCLQGKQAFTLQSRGDGNNGKASVHLYRRDDDVDDGNNYAEASVDFHGTKDMRNKMTNQSSYMYHQWLIKTNSIDTRNGTGVNDAAIDGLIEAFSGHRPVGLKVAKKPGAWHIYNHQKEQGGSGRHVGRSDGGKGGDDLYTKGDSHQWNICIDPEKDEDPPTFSDYDPDNRVQLPSNFPFNFANFTVGGTTVTPMDMHVLRKGAFNLVNSQVGKHSADKDKFYHLYLAGGTGKGDGKYAQCSKNSGELNPPGSKDDTRADGHTFYFETLEDRSPAAPDQGWTCENCNIIEKVGSDEWGGDSDDGADDGGDDEDGADEDPPNGDDDDDGADEDPPNGDDDDDGAVVVPPTPNGDGGGPSFLMITGVSLIIIGISIAVWLHLKNRKIGKKNELKNE
jgi:hypothetical protein